FALFCTLADGDEGSLAARVRSQSALDRFEHRIGIRTVIDQSGALGNVDAAFPSAEVLILQDFIERRSELEDLMVDRAAAQSSFDFDKQRALSQFDRRIDVVAEGRNLTSCVTK